MHLAGDIGGTKTVLAIFSSDTGPHQPLAMETFPSGQYDRLEAVVSAFLSRPNLPGPIDRACFGVAGPVISGKARITNLPWVMDEADVQRAFGWAWTRLLNDLESIAYALPVLEPADLHTISAGRPVAHGSLAVIAPGTGLGEAFLTWNGCSYQAHPSEGGHTSFAPINTQQIGLLRFLLDEAGHDHVSFERVCSGRLGIPNIYAYLRSSGFAPEPDWLAVRLAETDDPTPVIVGAALDPSRPCPLCSAALDMFVSILGAEAGNLALKVLATGGVYLGGGIPPRILPALRQPGFLESFQNKGRLSSPLADMPVHVILNSRAALFGAAACAMAG